MMDQQYDDQSWMQSGAPPDVASRMVPPSMPGGMQGAAPVGFVSTPRGGHGNVHIESTPAHQALVAELKELQRADPAAREQWTAFTDYQGEGRRDPAKHTEDFLRAFLSHFRSGARLTPHADAMGLVDVIKTLRRKSHSFRPAWQHFCKENGDGLNDPAKHDGAFMVAFFEWASSKAIEVGQGAWGGAAPGAVVGLGGDRKRMRVDAGPGAAFGHEHVVAQVKAFQRMGEQQRELWSTYADLYLGGIRDPARHDEATLREFCVNHHVPEVAAPLPAPPSVVGAAWQRGGGGAPEWQNSWPQSVGAAPGGSFASAHDQLIAQVKAFQRMGEQQRELWSTYVDLYLGGLRDPARHDEATLREFCVNHHVPEVAAPAAPATGGAWQGGQPGGGDWQWQAGAGGAGAAGGWKGGMPGGKGAIGAPTPPMPPMDPVKEMLVARVKAYQKGSREQAEAWKAFCGSGPGAAYDPARHDAGRLQEFVTTYGVP